MYFHDIRKLWLNQFREYQIKYPLEWNNLNVSLIDDYNELNSSTFGLTKLNYHKEDLLRLEISSTISTYSVPILYLRSDAHDWRRFNLNRYNEYLHKFFYQTDIATDNNIHPTVYKICKDILNIQFTFVRPAFCNMNIHLEFNCKCTS